MERLPRNRPVISALEPVAISMNRHCQRSAAIQRHQSLDCRASLAMTAGADLTHDALARQRRLGWGELTVGFWSGKR
jgi:hypothetical protein